jgi:hypothetical protein
MYLGTLLERRSRGGDLDDAGVRFGKRCTLALRRGFLIDAINEDIDL